MIERRCLRMVEDVELLKQAQPAGVGHGVEGLAPVNDVPLKSVGDPVIFQFPNISCQSCFRSQVWIFKRSFVRVPSFFKSSIRQTCVEFDLSCVLPCNLCCINNSRYRTSSRERAGSFILAVT